MMNTPEHETMPPILNRAMIADQASQITSLVRPLIAPVGGEKPSAHPPT